MGSVRPYTIVEGPEAWYADRYQVPASYTYILSSSDIAELDAAVAANSRPGRKIQV